MRSHFATTVPLLLLLGTGCSARLINYETDAGAVGDDSSNTTSWRNGDILNKTLAALAPGDVFVVPNKTFHLMGGIQVTNLSSVVVQLDGTLSFSDDIEAWPRNAAGRVHECLQFTDIRNVTFTSSGVGTLEGNGAAWWGVPGVGYLLRGENRPRLFKITGSASRDVLFENIFLHNSPYWTFTVDYIDGLEVRNSGIDARRTDSDEHTLIDLTAFNTDGFDISGKNVWVHDCTVWNQDDSFCVKDHSENMLFERIHASGLGLTIGSISGSVVNNITFRDCNMHHTYKGIYLKFRGGDSPGRISNILYENVVIDEPEQWAIWIGPAQQSDSPEPCAAHPCSLCWPQDKAAACNAPVAGSYINITLRNITINNPKMSPGVIFANSSNPMQHVLFDSVVVNDPASDPWGDKYYFCEGVANGRATGSTSPVPPCFTDETRPPALR